MKRERGSRGGPQRPSVPERWDNARIKHAAAWPGRLAAVDFGGGCLASVDETGAHSAEVVQHSWRMGHESIPEIRTVLPFYASSRRQHGQRSLHKAIRSGTIWTIARLLTLTADKPIRKLPL